MMSDAEAVAYVAYAIGECGESIEDYNPTWVAETLHEIFGTWDMSSIPEGPFWRAVAHTHYPS